MLECPTYMGYTVVETYSHNGRTYRITENGAVEIRTAIPKEAVIDFVHGGMIIFSFFMFLYLLFIRIPLQTHESPRDAVGHIMRGATHLFFTAR